MAFTLYIWKLQRRMVLSEITAYMFSPLPFSQLVPIGLCMMVILNITILCHEIGHWIPTYYFYRRDCTITMYPLSVWGNLVMLREKNVSSGPLRIRVKWFTSRWLDMWEPDSIELYGWQRLIIYPAGPIAGILATGLLHMILIQYASIYPYVYFALYVSYSAHGANLLPFAGWTDGTRFLEALGYQVPTYLHYFIATIIAVSGVSLGFYLRNNVDIMFRVATS